MKDADILKRIREIVERWEDDTWTDGLSYISMSEISDLLEKSEQEPILDKIRAEIADLDDANYDYEGYYKAVTDALQVIDKYRKEG